MIEIKTIFFPNSARMPSSLEFRLIVFICSKSELISNLQNQLRLLSSLWRHQHQNLINGLINQVKQVVFPFEELLTIRLKERLTRFLSERSNKTTNQLGKGPAKWRKSSKTTACSVPRAISLRSFYKQSVDVSLTSTIGLAKSTFSL